ncbi:MAG: hypothetical protein IK115_12920, partial [Lachnospiraceae bacterium]|nr:hypothetical protein [Lachnospiraceae bacterium]
MLVEYAARPEWENELRCAQGRVAAKPGIRKLTLAGYSLCQMLVEYAARPEWENELRCAQGRVAAKPGIRKL